MPSVTQQPGEAGAVILGATGGGGGPLSINGVVPPVLEGATVSCARVLTDTTIVYQRCGALPWNPATEGCWLEVYDHRLASLRVVLTAGANWIEAGGGVWARRLQDNSPTAYQDSLGRTSPEYKPLSVDPITGDVLALTSYSSGGGLTRLLAAGGVETLLPLSAVVTGASAYAGEWVATVAGSKNLVTSRGTFPLFDLSDVCLGAEFLVSAAGPGGLLLVDVLRGPRWAVISSDGKDYNPVIGHRLIASAVSPGEWPGTARRYVISEDLSSVNGAPLQWRQASTQPPPVPVPSPSDVIPMRPWPVTLWVSPYQSFNTNHWGNTTDFVGNCILWPESQAHAIALGQQGLPMVIAPETFAPEIESLVVGYYLHMATMDEAATHVADLRERVLAGTLPEKPLVLYVDGPDVWRIDQPAWLNPAWIWPSPQCYRAPGEALHAFDTRIRLTLDHLTSWGCTLYPTLHAYDRNGLGTEQEAIEALIVARDWADSFTFIGIAPFTDMRRGTLDGRVIGGMEVYPSLRKIVRSMQYANPRQRPNRYDGWVPMAGRKVTLTSKLSQSTHHPYLDDEDKRVLTAALNAYKEGW